MDVSELKALEEKNGKLKELLTDQMLDATALREENPLLRSRRRRTKVAKVADYNIRRPHSSLKYLTPRPMPPTSPQRTTGSATPISSADRPCSTRATWRTNHRDSNLRRMKLQG